MKKSKPNPPTASQAAPITDPETLPALLTVKDVAALLRRKPRSIYELVHKKAIPFLRPPKTGMIIFKRDVILEWSGYTKKPQS